MTVLAQRKKNLLATRKNMSMEHDNAKYECSQDCGKSKNKKIQIYLYFMYRCKIIIYIHKGCKQQQILKAHVEETNIHEPVKNLKEYK